MKNSILQQLKQYKGVFVAAPVLMIMSGIMETLIPLMTALQTKKKNCLETKGSSMP